MKIPDKIKRGLECCSRIGYGCGACPFFPCDCDELPPDALAYIQQLEAAQPRWISVEERLPESSGTVLIYMINPAGRFVITTAELERDKVKRGRHVWDIPARYYGYDYQVTHWMPLPQPPKEGE